MVNKDSINPLRILLWLLVIVAVVIVAVIIGLAVSGSGEIQAPGSDRGNIVEVV